MKKKTPQKAAVFFLSLSLLAGGFMASAEVRPADITITYDGSRTIQTSENDFFGEAGKNLMPGSSFTKEMDRRKLARMCMPSIWRNIRMHRK